MLRPYQYLVPALTCCALLAIAGTVHAATTITADAQPTAAETAAVRRALAGDFSEEERTEHHPLTFTVGHVDLNGDGRPDLIVHYTSQDWCGTTVPACWAYALLAVPGGYGTHAITLGPFDKTMTVLDAKHHGLHDLRYDDSTDVYRWDGTFYRHK